MKEILIPLNFTPNPVVYDTEQSFSTADASSAVLAFSTTEPLSGVVASLTIKNISQNANLTTVLIDRIEVSTSPFRYTFVKPLASGDYYGEIILKRNLEALGSAQFTFGVNSSLAAEVLPHLIQAYSLDDLVEQVEAEINNLKAAYNLNVESAEDRISTKETTITGKESIRALNETQRKANELTRIAQELSRVAAEGDRQETFTTLVDSAVIEQVVVQEVAEKYQELEATNSTEMVSFRQQLEQTNAQVDLLNRGLGQTFATLVALQTAYPTGDTKDHIVGADGHRYFWSGSAWSDGGIYQAIELLDDSVSYFKLESDLRNSIGYAIPSDILVLNADYNLDAMTSSSATTNFYSNGPLIYSGFLKGLNIKTGATQVAIIAAKKNPDNVSVTITHDYGVFPVVSTRVEVDDSSHVLSLDEQILVSFNGGTTYFINTSGGIELYANRTFKTNETSVRVAYEIEIAYPKTGYYPINTIQQNVNSLTSEVETINLEIDDIKNHLENKKLYKTVYSESFGASNADWTASDWTVDTVNGNAYPNASGGIIGNALTNYIRLNNQYCADRRVMRAKVILYVDTVMNLHFVRGTTNAGEGESFYQIDVPNKKLIMYKTDTDTRGVSTTLISASKDITEFNFIAGNTYIVEAEKNGWTFTLRIFDTVTGNVSTCSVIGWDAGRQNNTYAFSLQTGTAYKLLEFEVAILDNPTILFLGDSITEGVEMTSVDPAVNNRLSNVWCYVLGSAIGDCVNSGMGGDKADGVIARLQSEAALINPKFVVVTIGTNGGVAVNTQAKYQQIIDLCVTIGTTLILNHIPANNLSTPGNHIAVNQLIDSLVPKIGCKFDVATSNNYDVTQGVKTSLTADGVHPNYLGAIEMVKRVYIDAPEILTKG